MNHNLWYIVNLCKILKCNVGISRDTDNTYSMFRFPSSYWDIPTGSQIQKTIPTMNQILVLQQYENRLNPSNLLKMMANHSNCTTLCQFMITVRLDSLKLNRCFPESFTFLKSNLCKSKKPHRGYPQLVQTKL